MTAANKMLSVEQVNYLMILSHNEFIYSNRGLKNSVGKPVCYWSYGNPTKAKLPEYIEQTQKDNMICFKITLDEIVRPV